MTRRSEKRKWVLERSAILTARRDNLWASSEVILSASNVRRALVMNS